MRTIILILKVSEIPPNGKKTISANCRDLENGNIITIKVTRKPIQE